MLCNIYGGFLLAYALHGIDFVFCQKVWNVESIYKHSFVLLGGDDCQLKSWDVRASVDRPVATVSRYSIY